MLLHRFLACALALTLSLGAFAQPAAAPALFNVQTFGATGNRADNATRAIQSAIDACTAAGGGTVYVPPGAYTTGALHLKDNVDLHLEAGATLFLSQNLADFPKRPRSLINADGARNIAVTGRGTLDGLAAYVFDDERNDDPAVTDEQEIARAAGLPMKRYYRASLEAFMFVLNRSSDVRLENITVVGSPLWNIRLDQCDRVFIRGVHIHSDLEKGVNADGIDIVSSRNVLISDSIIVTADDAIALKTEARIGPAQPTENVTIANCVLTSSSAAVTIGTETLADIRHVLVTNCVIRDSNKGIGINVQDGATVSDVIFSNLPFDSRRRHWNWWGGAEAFRFTLPRRTPDSKLGVIRDVVIDNVIAHARGTSAILGHPEQPIENITISNLQLFMEPEDVPDKRATDAIQFARLSGLKLRNVSVKWNDRAPEPKWQSALRFQNVDHLDIADLTARQGLAPAAAPALVFENVRHALLRDSAAASNTHTFLELRGPGTTQITLRHNDTSAATTPVSFQSGATPAALIVH